MKRDQSTIAGQPVVRVVPANPRKGPPVLLLHGMGLGSWMWERDQKIWAELGLETVAVDLPGHGLDAGRDCGFDEIVEAADGVCKDLGSPIVVGHSMGGLVAQALSQRNTLSAMVLVCSVPPGQVNGVPPRRAVLAGLKQLRKVVSGNPIRFSKRDYRRTGLNMLAGKHMDSVYTQITDWPLQASLDLLLRRPRVSVPACPVLVTYGLQDGVSRPRVSRLIGDHYDAITWRFDDLGHMPPLEPGGERLAQAIGDWMCRPTRRRVVEVDAFSPGEGVGDEIRQSRRPAHKPRSHSRFRRRRPTRD
ncbi:MAG: alpha/beta hydrolase [Myxococcota bacterium]|nr:alpha/beta hydrolase [Myxococcota bacterium]